MTSLLLLNNYRRLAYRTHIRWNSTQIHSQLSGFQLWPAYFSDSDQRILLAASLHKLDSDEPIKSRRRLREYWKAKSKAVSESLSDLFAPDEVYDFQKGHFDGVIHDFREIHLSSWPLTEFPALEPVLQRLYRLCPESPLPLQTHLLHLASHGEILPHVDNLEASGSWILGVSLGDTRILRMKKKDSDGKELSWKLPSGSVYLQRDHVRYNYLHSIERHNSDDSIQTGQRLSIMIRNQNENATS